MPRSRAAPAGCPDTSLPPRAALAGAGAPPRSRRKPKHIAAEPPTVPWMIEIPAKLVKNHSETSADWLAALPGTAADYVDRWQLTVVGDPLSGEASLILPVVRKDGTEAMLKLQTVNEESESEALAL